MFSFSDSARAQQLPTGGTVVGGQATITQNGASQLTINQSTDRGIIDWRSFNIGQGNRVDFNQPGRASVTLNRVTGPDPSVIAGALNANGQIVLVNQAGVMFAGGAQVNVESLIASTANVSNPDRFMAGGKLAFDRAGANPNAQIVNNGNITVRDGGLVALVGPSAANNGVINARLGRVTIAGAETFTVDLNGDGLVNFAVGKPVSQTARDAQGKALALASNTGTINADGGVVAITASAARDVVDGVVNVGGRINARTVSNEGGVIVFGGGETTVVNVGGTIDVSGAGATQKGGTVHITAPRVNVQSTANINANGGAGGGRVLIGGGKQGAGPIANAKITTVAKGATITADATHKGDGGTVIVWADNTTIYRGSISAKGGPQGGNGGFAEVSGKVFLDFNGLVDLRATGGITGTLLLDPSDITISNAVNSKISSAGGTFTGTDDTSNLNVTVLLAALATANVVVDASGGPGSGAGTITVADTISSISANTLTLQAIKDITLNAKVNLPNGTVAFKTTTGQVVGTAQINGGVTLQVGGAVTLTNAANSITSISGTAGGAIQVTSDATLAIGALSSGSASLSVATSNSKSITVGGAVSGTGVTLTADSALSGSGSISGGTGAVALRANGSGGINLTGAVSGNGLTVTAGAGGVLLPGIANSFTTFSTSGAIGGNVSVVHNGALTVNAVDAGANSASFTTNAGSLTLSGALTATGGVSLIAAATLTVNAAITAASSTVALSGTSIAQGASGAITAGGLVATATTGSIDLTQATSTLTTVAAKASGGSIGLLESNGFTIGSVGGVDGITAGGTVQLSAGGGIGQSKAISAGSLAVRTSGGGNVDLTTYTNSIGTVAVSSAGFVGLLETDAVVIGSVGAVGALATLNGVTSTGIAAFRAGGAITQSQAISASGGLAAVTTSGAIDLGSVANATASVAFNSAGDISYRSSSAIAVASVAGVGGLSGVSGATTSGVLTLVSTGAATGIGQSQAISVATLDVATLGSGSVTLTTATNVIGTVRSTAGLGGGTHQIVDGSGGLAVNAITSSGDLTLTTSGGALTVSGAVSANGRTVSLRSTDAALTVGASINVGGTGTLALRSGGAGVITATAAAITAGTLSLETAATGGATVQVASHDVGTVRTAGAGVGSGGLSFAQSRAGGTTIGPVISAGTVTITDSSGALTLGGAITAPDVALTSKGALNLNARILATGNVALAAGGSIVQANAGAGIEASGLSAKTVSGGIGLAPTGTLTADVNTVSTFAASVGGSFDLSFSNTGSFNIGTVAGVTGITTPGTRSTSLRTTGSGAAITQSAGAAGAVATGTLNLATNGGSVTLESANNAIGTLGTVSLGAGAFSLVTAPGANFFVGTVSADGGISITNANGDLTTQSTISSAGSIALTSDTGVVSLGGDVTSTSGNVTVHARNTLSIGSVEISAGGDVTLVSDLGNVSTGPTASGAGVVAGKTLTLQAGPGGTVAVGGKLKAADINLVADQIAITQSVTATGAITIAPRSAGTQVSLGNPFLAAGLVVDSAELLLLSAPTLRIGRMPDGVTVSAGSILIGTAAIDAGTSSLALHATGAVTQDGTLTMNNSGGALSIAAGSVALSSSGVNVNSLGASASTGDFSVTFVDMSLTRFVGSVSATSGDIAIQNAQGGLFVTGPIAGSGNVLLGAAGVGAGITLNGTVNAAAVGLFAPGGITQAAPIIATHLIVSTAGGSITLNANNLVTGNVTLQAPSGSVSFTDLSNFLIAGATQFTAAGIVTAVNGGSGLLTGAGQTAALTLGGSLTQGGDPTDRISAGTLDINQLIVGTNPTVTLTNAANAVAQLGTVALGLGSLSLNVGGDLAIAGTTTAGGGVSLTSVNGSLTLGSGGGVDTSAGSGAIALTASGAGADVNLLGTLKTGASATVTLAANRDIVQTSGAITAAGVAASATNGGVSLDSTTNAFGAISGAAAGDFLAASTLSLTASDVSGASVTLKSSGNVVIDGNVTAAGTVNLLAAASVVDTANAAIVASKLQAVATSGAVALILGGAKHDVVIVAGSANTGFSYTDGKSTALSIGTVTSAGISTNSGNVAITANAGSLSIDAAVSANVASGVVSLVSTAGSVIEKAAGSVSAKALEVRAQTNVDVMQSANSVSQFAAQAVTGFVAFANGKSVQLDLVGATSGVTAGGAVAISTSAGNITQTAAGIVTTGSAGLLLQAALGSIVLGESNAIGGNVAVTGTLNGDITLRNAGAINVGGVGPISTVNGLVSGAGITGGTSRVLSLTSDNAAITQSGGAGNRIVVGELRAKTLGKAVTLDNTANEIASVGGAILGAGKLVVFDSDGGLNVLGSVTADGGVVLTTKSTLSVSNSITASAGDIVLAANSADIALGGNLSAGGLVQLDAGGGAINQTAGAIVATSLIARASGAVSLAKTANDVVNLAGSAGGRFIYVDKTAVTIGALSDAGASIVNGIATTNQDVTILAAAGGISGGIAVNQKIDAGGAIVRLQTAKGDITQGAAGVIAGASLLANATAGMVDLATAANAVSAVAGKASGTFRLLTTGALDVTSVATDADGLATARKGISTTNADIAIRTGGALMLSEALGAGSGTIRLRTGSGGISQATTGSITAQALLVDSAGAVDLTTSAGNDVATLAGRSTGAGFSYIDGTGLVVGSVSADTPLGIGALNGVSSAGSVVLTADGGGGTGGLSITQAITANGQSVLLNASGNISQSVAGVLIADDLQVVSTAGAVDLTAAGTSNRVNLIAGSANGDFAYTDGLSSTLRIGTVLKIGITSNAGDVAIAANGGVLRVDQAVTASAGGGDVSLQSKGDLLIGAALTSNGTNGRVSLTSSAGSVLEKSGGTIAGAQLLALAANDVDIRQSGNTVGASGFAAKATNGFVSFANDGAIRLDQLASTGGVSASGTVTLTTTIGDITQTAGGIVSAGAGLLLQAATGSIVLDQANAITGSIAVMSTTLGDITLRTSGALNVGTVGAGSGITGASGRFLSLTADGGTITQGGGAAQRIITGDLRVQTAGQDVTLANTANQVDTIGTVGLGAGKFTVFDSTSGLSITGALTANGGVTLTTSGLLTVSGSIGVSGKDIVLTSTGGGISLAGAVTASSGQVQLDAGGGAIAQTSGAITAISLIARAQGSVGLTRAGNDVVTVAGSSASGAFSYVDKNAVTVGALSDAGAATLNGVATASQDITIVGGAGGVAGGIAVDQTINAGGAIVRLQTTKGDVTQAAAGVITAASLLVNATSGAVDLTSAASVVSTVAGSAGGSFRLRTASALNVASVAADAGALTKAASGITTGNADLALQSGGALSLSQALSAGSGTIRLRTLAGGVSQTAAGAITGQALLVDAFGGVALATATTNDVAILAGRSTTGSFTYADATGLTLGAVGADALLSIGPLSGVTAPGGVSVTSDIGGGTAGLIIAQAIDASGQTLRLIAAGDITQTLTGGIKAANLQAVSSAGNVDLTIASAGNGVGIIAGSANGSFAYTDGLSSALTVGTVTTIGVTSTTGNATIKANAGTLSVAQSVSATGGSVSLQSKGTVTLNAGVAANTGSGIVSLVSIAGSVIENSGGSATGALLEARAATNVDVAQAANTVNGFAASATGGFVAFANNAAVQLQAVGGTSGVSAGGTVVISTSTGNITQTAAGIVTAGTGLLLRASNGSIVLDQSNAVSGNIAVVGTLSGDITLRNSGALNIGTVGTVATVGAFNAGAGITGGTARFLSLRSDGGTITQGGAVGDRIIGGTLRAQTAGKDVTLANGANQFESVGTVTLGAGKFTLLDSAGGLVVDGPLSADGGVVLTTNGALSLPGSVTVAGGDILLTSTAAGIALSSTLSASGQIQLDAGGGAITQTAGTITAASLIARGQASVSLAQAGNDVVMLAGSSATGTFTYVDKTAVAIAALTDAAAGAVNGIATTNRDITVVAGSGGVSGGVAVDQIVNAGSAIVRLQTAKGDVTQGAAGVITAGSLLVNATTGAVDLSTVGSAVSAVAGKSGGSFRLLSTGPLQIASVATDAGALVDAASGITTGNADIALQSGGALSLNQALGAGTGTIRLRTIVGGISQATAGKITGQALLVDSAGAVALATATTNDVVTVAGRSATGSFTYADATGLTVGSVTADSALTIGPLDGIAAPGGVTVTTDVGGGAAGLSITRAIDAGGQTLRLIAAGAISQGSSGTLTAANLNVTSSAGAVELTAAAATNKVAVIAGSANGDFAYTDGLSAALTVGTVTTVGIASVTGNVSITANGGTLTIDKAVSATATGANVTLQGQGDLSLNATVAANAATGVVSLMSVAGSVVENSGGAVTGNGLQARAAVNVDVAQAANAVNRFAADATTGFVAFANSGAIDIAQIGVTSGVSAGGTVVLAAASGDITQSQLITAGNGLLVQAANGAIVLGGANLITGNVAVVSTLNGDITLGSSGSLTIGAVGPVTSGGALVSGAGITAGTTRTLTLISNAGTITQGSGAADRIIAGALNAQTAGQDVTLDNLANRFESIGTVSLGAGKLTVFDSAGGLVVNGPLTADGGVVLTTNGVLSLPGTISVANGDILLTSTAGSIALDGTLSAAIGQVELRADTTIAQTAGSITAKTLIARAGRDIDLSQANEVDTLAGKSTTGTFTYVDKTAVIIGGLTDSGSATVNGVATKNRDIVVVAGGGIAVEQAVNAGTAIVRLRTATGDVTQGIAGAITAGGLLVNAMSGSINLAAAANDVAAIAGKSDGSFRLLTAGAVQVTTVAADAAALTIAASGIATTNADIAIQSAGALTLNRGLAAGTGTIRLRTIAGGISQSASGAITAKALLVDAAGAVALANSAANDVDILAGRSTGGRFAFADSTGLKIGTVTIDGAGLGPTLAIGPLTGVSTPNADITLSAGGALSIDKAVNGGTGGIVRLQAGAGDLTQSATGAVTGGTLVAVSTGGMVDLTRAKNVVQRGGGAAGGLAGSAFTSFLFQNSAGLTIATAAIAGDGVVSGMTGVTANAGGGAAPRVVDIAVAAGDLTVIGPVSSANGMIVYRRAENGAAGTITVGGDAGTPSNALGSAKLMVIDLTGLSPLVLYGSTPGSKLGGLFTAPTPAQGISPVNALGNVSGGQINIGAMSAADSTVYLFGDAATFETSSNGSTFGVLGVYGNGLSANLSTTVLNMDPRTVRFVTDPYTGSLVGGSTAAFFVRHSGVPNPKELFNGCPIATVNCTVFQTPIGSPQFDSDSVIIGVAGAPLDDSGVILVNQGNEDLILEVDGETRRRKRDDE